MTTLRGFVLLLVLLALPIAVLAGSIENNYSIPEPDEVQPDSYRTWYVPISGVPSGAIITKVEAKFDYTAYGVVQDFVSVRFNRGSDPGSSGGALLVADGDLPPGNPGSLNWVSLHDWDGQSVNANYYFRFMLGGGSPYTCTIHGIYVRVTYDVSPPILIQPSHLSIHNRLTTPSLTFMWTAIAGATQYHINVFPDGDSGSPVIFEYVTPAHLSWDIGDWPNANYIYEVRAFIGGSWTAWSTANQFIVDAPPGPPPLTAPANGTSIDIGSTTNFTWGESPDSPIERYYFRLVRGTDLAVTPLHQIETTGQSANVTFDDATYDQGVHTWGVRAIKQTPAGYNDTAYETTIGWGLYNFRTITLVDQSAGYVSVSQGLTVTPNPVELEEEFIVDFTLKEVAGGSITFEQIAVDLRREDDSFLLTLQTWNDVTIGAHGTWSRTPSGVITGHPPGTYKAVVRLKLTGGDWHDISTTEEGVNPRSFVVWPSCEPACLVLKIEEDAGSDRVHYARLWWIDPLGAGGHGNIESLRQVTVDVVDGFAVFDSGLDIWTDSIELLDVDEKRIGHIGYKWEGGSVEVKQHAFLFLHDELGEEWPWNSESPPQEWIPIEEGWNYYEDGDYPVSMLIPPNSSVFQVGHPNDKPVLFIHGFAGYFNYWGGTPEYVGSIEDMPCDAWRFCFPYDQPIQASAMLLGIAIEKLLSGELLGAPDYFTRRIDLVAHSMGGLVARSWIQSDAFEETGDPVDPGNVNSLLMFATPNHGSHISYRMYEEDFLVAEILEWFLAHDPEAPALRQMIPASNWIFELIEDPPKPLGHGTPSMDYLVVAGTKDIALLPHAEIGSQDDGCVSVSSANLLRHDIPLALVDEEHREIHKPPGAGPLIREFLSDGYNPSNPIFAQGSNPWVFEYVSNWRGSALDRTINSGILEFQIDWADPAIDHYNVQYDDQYIYLEPDMSQHEPVIFPRLERCWDGSAGFFSRRRTLFDFDLLTIGVELPANTYDIQVRRRGRAWLDWGWVWGWVIDADCHESLRFDPLFTTVSKLTVRETGLLAMGATNSTPLEQVEGRSPSYRYYVDASLDTLVVSLSSFEEFPDFSMHNMTLEDPSGQIIDPATALSDPTMDYSENLQIGLVQYALTSPSVGYWVVRHDSSVHSPVVFAYSYGDVYADLVVSPSTCEVGATLYCQVETAMLELYDEYELHLVGYYQHPDSTLPMSFGDVQLEDLGNGVFQGDVPEVDAGEYLFALSAICVTESGDSLHLTDCGTAIVTTDETPVEPTDPEDGDGQSPDIQTTQLLGAWPNPFNPSVKVELYSAREQRIRVAVFDITGRRIRQLLDSEVPAGRLSVDWDGIDENDNSVPSGVYLIQFQAKGLSDSRKVVLLK